MKPLYPGVPDIHSLKSVLAMGYAVTTDGLAWPGNAGWERPDGSLYGAEPTILVKSNWRDGPPKKQPTMADRFDAAHKKIEAQVDREWSAFPAWDDMTENQKQSAVAIAGRQGERMQALRKKYETGTV